MKRRWSNEVLDFFGTVGQYCNESDILLSYRLIKVFAFFSKKESEQLNGVFHGELGVAFIDYLFIG